MNDQKDLILKNVVGGVLQFVINDDIGSKTYTQQNCTDFYINREEAEQIVDFLTKRFGIEKRPSSVD